jgi:acylphosphatase
MSHERRRGHFSGRVQGVGFRYTACEIAQSYDVTGYVQNLRDGRVLLVAEGEAATLDEFIAAVHDRLRPYIAEVQCETLAATGEFDGFGVRY